MVLLVRHGNILSPEQRNAQVPNRSCIRDIAYHIDGHIFS